MITYQVRIKVQASICSEWITFMQKEHVPKLLATGLIHSSQVMKSREEEFLYIFHYHFLTEDKYHSYINQHADEMRAHVLERYEGKFHAERSLLDWV